jgi:hypothetical protein
MKFTSNLDKSTGTYLKGSFAHFKNSCKKGLSSLSNAFEAGKNILKAIDNCFVEALPSVAEGVWNLGKSIVNLFVDPENATASFNAAKNNFSDAGTSFKAAGTSVQKSFDSAKTSFNDEVESICDGLDSVALLASAAVSGATEAGSYANQAVGTVSKYFLPMKHLHQEKHSAVELADLSDNQPDLELGLAEANRVVMAPAA